VLFSAKRYRVDSKQSAPSFSKRKRSQVCWYMPIIPALGKLKQEDCKVKARLGYIVRPSLKKKKRGLEVWHCLANTKALSLNPSTKKKKKKRPGGGD
jgi:hypothetical protein